jgi:nucleoside-diphosphate-sugar epimerase
MESVIVTGANGFIGSTLVHNLLKKDVKVVAIDISFANPRIPDCDNVLKLEVGLDEVEKLKALIPAMNYDAMYHLAWAGVNGPSKADPTVQLNNIQLGINCAQLCKAIGVKKLLCAGTVAEQAVHSLPNLPQTSGGMLYGVAKHCAHLILEDYCKNIGLQFVWMQFSNIYGVGNKTGNLVSYTLSELLKGNEPTFGPATQPYDFIYVDDLLEAVYRLGASQTDRSCYYIGSGAPHILKEYLLKIGELAGLRENIGIGIRPDDGIKYDFSMFDIAPLREAIGDFVSTSFEDGIKKTIIWLKELQ